MAQEGFNVTEGELAPAEEEQPKKKRYYTPQEVMQKKGCIGCGGMVLGVLGGLLILIWVIALL